MAKNIPRSPVRSSHHLPKKCPCAPKKDARDNFASPLRTLRPTKCPNAPKKLRPSTKLKIQSALRKLSVMAAFGMGGSQRANRRHTRELSESMSMGGGPPE